jgi:hypothetical protein
VAHTCDPCYPGGRDWEVAVQGQPWGTSSREPTLKIPNTEKKKRKKEKEKKIPHTKQGSWSGSSGEHLPRKCEALSSNPSTAKIKKSASYSPLLIFMAREQAQLPSPLYR